MRRAALAALLLSLAAPAVAYLPPAPAILRRVAQHRDELRLGSMEVRGTITFSGEAAQRARIASGLAVDAGDMTTPATLLLKIPGRCRLELAPAGTPAALRPAVSEHGGHVTGHRGLDGLPAARALVDGVCALLAERGGGEPERGGVGQRLAERGVDLREVALGRLQGHVAWVLGGRPLDTRPQAWFDKQAFQPVRIIASFGGSRRDVRLLDFGVEPGGDRFPRTVEVWADGQLEARFSTENVTPNPRLSDTIF